MAQGPGHERLDAHVAGQKLSLSTNSLLGIVFIGLIGVLLWLFAGSGQVILQRDIADRHRIAQEHQQALEAIRVRLEQQHEAEMDRQLEVARAVLRVLISVDWNLRHLGESEELPFGTLPPWFTPPPAPVPK